MAHKKPIAVFDIDGTITLSRDTLVPGFDEAVHVLFQSGWKILFVSGRTSKWSFHLLKNLKIPYFLAVFNGAKIYRMPVKEMQRDEEISLHKMQKLCHLLKNFDIAAVAYSSQGTLENAYFIPATCNEELINHISERAKKLLDPYITLESFTDLEKYPCIAIRLYCLPEVALAIAEEIKTHIGVEAFCMKDSLNEKYMIVQVTHDGISKKNAIEYVMQNDCIEGTIVACGDDYNDIPMFDIANVKIAMPHAPQELKDKATVIAKDSLISALQELQHL